jgi:hypothetical protein
MLYFKKISFTILYLLLVSFNDAEVYYISSSEGNDDNDGFSIQTPIKSIDKLNTIIFNPGDSILFKSGDYWQGMFWLNGSGSSSHPIVVDVYGGDNRPIIDGFGYQASILIFNDQNIKINSLELTNSFSHIEQDTTTISAQTPNLFSNGPNISWTNVYTACEVGDGNNGSAQSFEINVTNIPEGGANYRVARTVANGNWYFSNTQSLSLGINTVNVNKVDFDRTVKFQFSSGNIEFNKILLNNQAIYEGTVKKLIGYGESENSWGSGKNVRFGIKVVSTALDLENFSFDNLYIHDIYPTPEINENIHLGYGIKLETQSDTVSKLFNTISNVKLTNTTITKTGHYGFWIKSLGLNGIDSIKNKQIFVENCVFENTGGSGFVPNKSENVIVQNCIFNYTGSSIDHRMWKRGSGMWPFDCKNVIAQHNKFMNARGPMDSYGAHIDYGNENVVFQYNYSFNNEGGFVEILGDNINCGYRYNISLNDGYREDPNGTPWNKKGKIFWISNYCGNNTVRCPSVGTFIYNNTIYLNETLNPDLENNAFYENPMLLNLNYLGENNPEAYQIQNNSPAIGNGFLINGSNDTINYINHNGGRDYFGNNVSHDFPSNIGAYNGDESVDILLSKEDQLEIYPSVTFDYVNISIIDYAGLIKTEIFSLSGGFLDIQTGDMLSFNKFNPGTYLCFISYENKIKLLKVVKL